MKIWKITTQNYFVCFYFILSFCFKGNKWADTIRLDSNFSMVLHSVLLVISVLVSFLATNQWQPTLAWAVPLNPDNKARMTKA